MRQAILYSLLFFLVLIAGCGPSVSTSEQISQFNTAGPVGMANDSGEGFTGAPGPYRVIIGDVLEFQMQAELHVFSGELNDWLTPKYGYRETMPYTVRIDDKGNITLPIVGDIAVAGKTLAEVEASVKSAYYPEYVTNPPMLFCQVKEYQAEHERVFTVMGLVNKPDAYAYPPDVQYNLMEAIAFAGGFDMIADPKFVKVFRQDTLGKVMEATFSVESKDLSKAYGVVIKPGDVIYVEHTLNTRMNKFLSDVFHITVGASVDAANLN